MIKYEDDDADQDYGALSPLGAALEALEALRLEAKKPLTAEEIKAAVAEALDRLQPVNPMKFLLVIEDRDSGGGWPTPTDSHHSQF